ncbi:saccharopine dehydrogenase [Phytophthora cinnamomi]|uniref:saccharopine dehydrogenase n=1 Tax=Phytophthora cinnamomi TaxID=4785 RepID=UPI003559CCE0|nr:saccharopine dehydrogenase [Phytophthora cinnamomi]
MSKQLDVVVFGATGFTGAVAARQLITEPESALSSPNAIKWALAARSASKLAALKEELVLKLPEVGSKLIDVIPTLIADSNDESSLVSMVKQTKVVLSLVGPYMLNGELLVKLCDGTAGVHYCDPTGEMLWVREMIRKYQNVAARSGASS